MIIIRILIVEDESDQAVGLNNTLVDLGHKPIGIEKSTTKLMR